MFRVSGAKNSKKSNTKQRNCQNFITSKTSAVVGVALLVLFAVVRDRE